MLLLEENVLKFHDAVKGDGRMHLQIHLPRASQHRPQPLMRVGMGNMGLSRDCFSSYILKIYMEIDIVCVCVCMCMCVCVCVCVCMCVCVCVCVWGVFSPFIRIF